MPGFIARKLCPKLVIIKPDFEKYSKCSELSREVFREYDPHFVARSMDEAYLNITRVCQERSLSSAEVADEIRSKVKERTKLTCSAGVAANRLLAKVCSDINKPDGQYVLPNERKVIMDFISCLPIRKIGGIGKVSEKLLREGLAVTTCGQLLEQRALLSALFSKISTDFFIAVGMGVGGSLEPEVEGRKSLSCERTFHAISHPVDLNKKLEELAESLAKDMADEGLMGKTLTLKLKTTAFEVRTRASTLPKFIASRDEIFPTALKLLQAELPISVRLMGLRLSNFKGEKATPSDPHQQTLNSFFTPANNTDTINNVEQCPQEPVIDQKPISCPISHIEETTAQESGISKGFLCESNTGANSHLDGTAIDHGRYSHHFSNSSESTLRLSENGEGHDYDREVLGDSSWKWEETANVEDHRFQKDSIQGGNWDPGEEFVFDCKEQWNYNENERQSPTYPSPFGPRDWYFGRENLDGGETSSYDTDRVNNLVSESLQMGRQGVEPTGATNVGSGDGGERREERGKRREEGNKSREERDERELKSCKEYVKIDSSLETETDNRIVLDSKNLVTASAPESRPTKSLFHYYGEGGRDYIHRDDNNFNGIGRQPQSEVNSPTADGNGGERLHFSGCGEEGGMTVKTDASSIRDGHESCHSGRPDIEKEENRSTEDLVNKVEWTETTDGYFLCNLCGEKFKVDNFCMFEHEDFHFAQMLQEREMQGGSSFRPSTFSIQGTHTGAQRGGRTSRTPPKVNSRKNRATGIPTGHQKRSKLLTMDAFLTKTSTS